MSNERIEALPAVYAIEIRNYKEAVLLQGVCHEYMDKYTTGELVRYIKNRSWYPLHIAKGLAYFGLVSHVTPFSDVTITNVYTVADAVRLFTNGVDDINIIDVGVLGGGVYE